MNMGPPVSWSRSWRSATSSGALPPPPPVRLLLLLLWWWCWWWWWWCWSVVAGGGGGGGCGCCGDIGLLPGEQSDALSGMSFSVSGSTRAARRMPIRALWLAEPLLPLPPTSCCGSNGAAFCDAAAAAAAVAAAAAAAWFWCRFSMDLDLRWCSGERFIDSADADGVDLPLFPVKIACKRHAVIANDGNDNNGHCVFSYANTASLNTRVNNVVKKIPQKKEQILENFF